MESCIESDDNNHFLVWQNNFFSGNIARCSESELVGVLRSWLNDETMLSSNIRKSYK